MAIREDTAWLKCVEATATRYHTFANSLSLDLDEGGKFLGVNFDRHSYFGAMQDLLHGIEDLLPHFLRTFSGKSLLGETCRVRLKLVRNNDVADAWVHQPGNDLVEIVVTSGVFIFLDIAAASSHVHMFESFGEDALKEPRHRDDPADFDRLMSRAASVSLRALLPEGLPEIRRRRFVHFVKNADDERRRYWHELTFLGLVWIVMHEIGHLMCGHVGALLSDKSVRLRENNGLSARASQRDPVFAIARRRTQRSAELMADAYATIRTAMVIQALPEKHFKTSGVFPGSLPFASQIALLMFEAADAPTSAEHTIPDGTHPAHWTRLFGTFATIFFLARPLPSTHSDPRKNPLKDTVSSQITHYFNFGAMILDEYESAKSFLITLGLRPPDLANRPGEFEQFIFAILLSQKGIGIPGHNFFTNTQELAIAPEISEWISLFRRLCTETNILFGAHLRPEWMTGGGGTLLASELRDDDPLFQQLLKGSSSNALILPVGLTDDPAYKILDDWMSNVYVGSTMNGEQLAAFAMACGEDALTMARVYRTYFRGAINFSTLVPSEQRRGHGK